MSRRHTPTPLLRLPRALAAALLVALIAAASLPGLASAQGSVRDRALEYTWQLVTYLAGGPATSGASLQPVPAGVGATLLLIAGEDARGEAACSSYQTTYDVSGQSLFVFPAEPQYVECDPASRAFDDVFYDLLESTESFQLTNSILVLKDGIGEQLMAFTRAKIEQDPTVARWDLARIGDADGTVEPVIAGLSPWIEFLRGGSIVGDTGCGSFFGHYVTSEGTIDISDVRYRLETCTDGAAAQAEKMATTLGEVSRFEVLPAGLRLQDENATTRLALSPDIDLLARTWTPTALFGPGGDVLEVGGRSLEGDILSTSAVKLQGDTADGGSICRPFTAKGLRDGLALSIRNVKPNGKQCKEPKGNKVDLPAVEQAFLNGLKATASHALRGSELEFKDVNGRPLMRLEPQAELIGPTWVVDWLGRGREEPQAGEPPIMTFTDSGLVLGETGVVRGGERNTFFADFETPQATRIIIENFDAGKACAGKKSQQPACKEQATFLELLNDADRYIAREIDLKLFRGPQAIMRLIPEHLLADDEE